MCETMRAIVTRIDAHSAAAVELAVVVMLFCVAHNVISAYGALDR